MDGKACDELDNLLHVDETMLDVQWAKQPRLVWKYVRLAADASHNVDEAKAYLDVVKSEVAKFIRKNPKKFGLDRVTDTSIDKIVVRNKRYKKALADLIQAKYELNLCNGAVKAVDRMKDTLSNFVSLHGRSYFSQPKIREHKDMGVSPVRSPLRTKKKKKKSRKKRHVS